MITEKEISEGFSAVWKSTLPMLTSNFIRVFNESHVKPVDELTNSTVETSNPSIALIISEFSFLMAKDIFENDLNEVEAFEDRNLISKNLILSNSLALSNHPDSDSVDSLRLAELEEAEKLVYNILNFIGNKKNETKFFPKLKGYGILGNCQADISIENVLYEVKTVNRTFRSKDLKQLILYLALNYVSGSEKFKYAGLFNPRWDVYCLFNVEGLIGTLSGGRSSGVIFYDLLESLVREVEIDSKF